MNMMKLGARDYFVKDTLLFERLTEVVKRIRIELDTEKKLEQVKNDLDDKEARYKLLVENSGIGVGLYSLDGKILFFNQKAVQDLGGVKEDYIGRNLVEVFGPVLGSKYQKRIEEVVENDTTLEFTDFIPDKSSLISNKVLYLSINSFLLAPSILKISPIKLRY